MRFKSYNITNISVIQCVDGFKNWISHVKISYLTKNKIKIISLDINTIVTYHVVYRHAYRHSAIGKNATLC